MKLIPVIIMLLMMSLPVSAQKVLFKSKNFSVYTNKVTENEYEAVAGSKDEIKSSYKSNYKVVTPDVISFKFSINGLDNERAVGENHELLLKPVNGEFTSPVYVFGKGDPQGSGDDKKPGNLSENTALTLRVDMRDILKDFKTKGYYQTFDGNKIYKNNFKGIYVAGGIPPLSWDFGSLKDHPEFKLTDPDGDGIYETTFKINKVQYPGGRNEKWLTWKLGKDISAYPSYKSPDVLIDALYNKAMEEMLMNVRDDGAFMAGAKWPGVWTRDISYSIFLSLAMVNPDASKVSLLAKVKNDRIIQDTGTGGAWPISSDRLVWAIAAWEVYKSTGDKDWLKKAYTIIKNSADDDLNTVFDNSTGLFRGESSFLDWREQTYPRWMDPKDIYSSFNLGTNAVHYQALKILAEMSKELGQSPDRYLNIAQRVKDGMNKLLWMKDKGYYGQYLYGRNYKSLSPKSEALGEGLSVLFGIAENERGAEVISHTPVTKYGVSCIYPQIPNIPPYHNNAVWPFVESYWAWASAKTGNENSVLRALASVYRAAALFMTDKENMVASTGDYLGTEINSDRQLWSVAGDLALTYRVIFGINLNANSISFRPFIPKEYSGERTLKNFKYRDAVLSISIKGYGDKIQSITLDGKPVKDEIGGNLRGNHIINIKMNDKIESESSVNLVDVDFSPETPAVNSKGDVLTWKAVDGASDYSVFKNGEKIASVKSPVFNIKENTGFADYQVLAINSNGLQSFLSEPLTINSDNVKIQPGAESTGFKTKYAGFTGNGYVVLDKNKFPGQTVKFEADIKEEGTYAVDFRYANGNGPINTDNKCAVRTLSVDGKICGPVVLPQRGTDSWTDWGYTNSIKENLSKGHHKFTLTFGTSDNNMNLFINSCLVDCMRIRKLK